MTRFSASDAAIEGFNVIRRHWRVVAGWAGFNLLALVMMVVLTVVLLLILTALGGGGTPGMAAGAIGGFVAGLGTLLAQAIVVCGLYRLLLRPEQPAFLHLRLGRDELRLLGVWLIWIAALAVAAAITAGVGTAAGSAGGGAAALIAFAVMVYLALRLCLLAPISFAEARIDFARSWRLTRGRVWALVGMALLTACLIALVAILAWLLLLLIVGLTSGFQGLAAVTTGVDGLESHPGPYLLNLAAQILFAPVLWVLSQAPLAAAYKALLAADEGA